MSNIPPYQMGPAEGGSPPVTQKTNVWVWVLLGMAGMCVLCGAIGAAILFPVFAQARKSAQAASTLSTLKGVNLAAVLYGADSDDVYPPFKSAEDISKKLDKYFRTSRERQISPNLNWNLELSGRSMTNISESNKAWIFSYVRQDNPAKTYVGYADSHIKLEDTDKFASIKADTTKMLKNP
ncbi:MAG: hypothetical protein WCG75_09810 [Armatimonadota bacterium]